MKEIVKSLKIWNTPNPARYRVFIKYLKNAIEVQNKVNEAPVDNYNNSDVCDTFSYEDYPIYVMPDKDLVDIKLKYDSVNTQKINEVIKL